LLNCFAVLQYLIAETWTAEDHIISVHLYTKALIIVHYCWFLPSLHFLPWWDLLGFFIECTFYLSFRQKFILLPSPVHFFRLIPWTQFRPNLLRHSISIGPIYYLLRFLFFISPLTRGILTSHSATWLIICPMLEKYIMIFFILLFMQNCISIPNLWNNHEKNLNVFF